MKVVLWALLILFSDKEAQITDGVPHRETCEELAARARVEYEHRPWATQPTAILCKQIITYIPVEGGGAEHGF